MTNNDAQTSSAGSTSGSKPSEKAVEGFKHEVSAGATGAVDTVKHVAGDVADAAKKAAESQVSTGKKMAVESLGTVVDALRSTGKHLGMNDSGLAEYVDGAASKVEDLSSYLETRTLSQLMGDVERYARREPAMFLGGAFLAGLLGGRFLKSSAPAPSPRPAFGAPSGYENTLPALPAYARTAPSSPVATSAGTSTYRPDAASGIAMSGPTSTPPSSSYAGGGSTSRPGFGANSPAPSSTTAARPEPSTPSNAATSSASSKAAKPGDDAPKSASAAVAPPVPKTTGSLS